MILVIRPTTATATQKRKEKKRRYWSQYDRTAEKEGAMNPLLNVVSSWEETKRFTKEDKMTKGLGEFIRAEMVDDVESWQASGWLKFKVRDTRITPHNSHHQTCFNSIGLSKTKESHGLAVSWTFNGWSFFVKMDYGSVNREIRSIRKWRVCRPFGASFHISFFFLAFSQWNLRL